MDIDKNGILNTFINGNYIYKAMEFYQKNGFKLISVPLCVDLESSLHTLNKNVKNIKLNNRYKNSYYVGSAEQSFVYLHSINKLSNGSYMAITPCSRDEIEDDLHLCIFLKIELIFVGEHNLKKMLNNSINFFSLITDNIKTVPSGNRPNEIDININNIEVGSYGLGLMKDGTTYTYGTGLAEPRLSRALNFNIDNKK